VGIKGPNVTVKVEPDKVKEQVLSKLIVKRLPVANQVFARPLKKK
jgi:hypothetical protein